MNAELNLNFASALHARVEALSQKIETLAATGRKDEADHQKAARNIYGIFLALLEKKAEEAAIRRLFTTLPDAWHTSRSLALAYNDYARTAIEDMKLAALDDIKTLYARAAGADPSSPARGEREVNQNA